jgi:hypothetical protein
MADEQDMFAAPFMFGEQMAGATAFQSRRQVII